MKRKKEIKKPFINTVQVVILPLRHPDLRAIIVSPTTNPDLATSDLATIASWINAGPPSSGTPTSSGIVGGRKFEGERCISIAHHSCKAIPWIIGIIGRGLSNVWIKCCASRHKFIWLENEWWETVSTLGLLYGHVIWIYLLVSSPQPRVRTPKRSSALRRLPARHQNVPSSKAKTSNLFF